MAEYIKREDVLYRFTFEHGDRIPEVDENNYPNTITIKEIKHIISDIPAANVAPVRQGEWKWEEEWYDNECIDCGWECSICHVALEDIVGGDWDDRFNPPKLRYCPNCGAKMNV